MKEKKKNFERRRHQRIRGINLIKVIEEQKDYSESITNVIDFSESGVSFRIKKELKLGWSVKIIMNVPDQGKNVYADAKVVWAHPDQKKEGYIVGCTYTQITNQDRRVFKTILEVLTSD